jgi:SAM-dependent methyltransferase
MAGHHRDWEELGELDPLWAVLTYADKRFGRWTPEEFFATGREKVEGIMAVADRLALPRSRDRVLDFGCGVGRLTRGLSPYFKQCIGLDISENMLAAARKLNQSLANCDFIQNPGNDLSSFPDRHFDMVVSNIVLQHMPSRRIAERYVAEFVRVLRPGGLIVFQMPSHIPLRNRIQPRRRAYRLLHALGVRAQVLYQKLQLSPIRMISIPENQIRSLLERCGATVLEVQPDSDAGGNMQSRTYFATFPAS